jgi:hypothetical protein
MSKKGRQYIPEQIINKLGEVEVLLIPRTFWGVFYN